MQINMRAGILGAGLGSRLQSQAKAKPLAPIAGGTLLGMMVSRLRLAGLTNIHCALREELLTSQDRAALPKEEGLSYCFVNTDSSLHTLVELIQRMDKESGPILFTMADTVLKEADLRAFIAFCRKLGPEECAVLTTTFVDDEKPLWAHLREDGTVEKFSSEPAKVVTSGMYYLTPQAMEIAEEVLRSGTHKMRNFLSALAGKDIPINSFVVSKTIDVDHPSDLQKAADFLQSD